MLPLPLAILSLLLQPLLRACGCCGATTLLLPVAGRQASLAAVAAMATLADVCPHHETERGAAAKVLGRTGSEGVRGGFREQSWKGCLRASFCRCKPNFRGLGVYVPRSVDWHRASRCIISLIQRNTDGNQVAPLTREHPRRRYTPVDIPGITADPRRGDVLIADERRGRSSDARSAERGEAFLAPRCRPWLRVRRRLPAVRCHCWPGCV